MRVGFQRGLSAGESGQTQDNYLQICGNLSVTPVLVRAPAFRTCFC